MNVEIMQLLIGWCKAKAQKSLLNSRHYVTILVFEGQSLEISHIVPLRSFQSTNEPPACDTGGAAPQWHAPASRHPARSPSIPG